MPILLLQVRSVACDSSTSNEDDLRGETGKPTGSAKKRFYVKISREEGGDVEEVPTNVAGLLPFITLRVQCFSFKYFFLSNINFKNQSRCIGSLVLVSYLVNAPACPSLENVIFSR